MAALDALDKDFPSNPGQFASFEDSGEEFKKLFDIALYNKEFKAGQVVEGVILKTHR